MKTYALYRPGRDPPPGNALPKGGLPEAKAQREELREELGEQIPIPLWWQDGDQVSPLYDALIDERMFEMTVAERIDLELRLLERRKTYHSFDYDPLR